MWQLLMPLALWLGAVGLGRAELTAAQQRGLQVALEEFHKHPPVQWAFRETGVDSATETPFPAGTFVRLEFKLQQTSCRKKDWKKAECKIKPNGRKRKCLACIKLNSADKVLGRMVHCPIHTQALRECGGGCHRRRKHRPQGYSPRGHPPRNPLAPGPEQLPLPAGARGAPGGSVRQGGARGRGPPQLLLPRTVCLLQGPAPELRPDSR